jgi:hypothetical protein
MECCALSVRVTDVSEVLAVLLSILLEAASLSEMIVPTSQQGVKSQVIVGFRENLKSCLYINC